MPLCFVNCRPGSICALLIITARSFNNRLAAMAHSGRSPGHRAGSQTRLGSNYRSVVKDKIAGTVTNF